MRNSFKSPGDPLWSVFLIFLKRNGAYNSFMRNRSKFKSHLFYVRLEDASPVCYILCAFRWASTPEGLKYWNLLNNKWKLTLDLFNF